MKKIYFFTLILPFCFFSCTEEISEQTASDTVIIKEILLEDNVGNSFTVEISHKDKELVEAYDVNRLEMILNGEVIKPSIKVGKSMSTKHGDMIVNKGNDIGINIIDVQLKENIKKFGIKFNSIEIENLEGNDDVKERWRFTPAFIASASCVGCKVIGLESGIYDETKWRCSMQYEIGYAIGSNFYPTEGGSLDQDGEAFLYYFPSGLNQNLYYFRWDEDGYNCDVNNITLNGYRPDLGVTWLKI